MDIDDEENESIRPKDSPLLKLWLSVCDAFEACDW